jgi:hypothetical protein
MEWKKPEEELPDMNVDVLCLWEAGEIPWWSVSVRFGDEWQDDKGRIHKAPPLAWAPLELPEWVK